MARQEAAVTIQAHGGETRTQRERGGKGSFRTHQLREEFDVGMEGVNGEDSRVCGLEPGMGGHAGQGSGQGRGRAGAGAQTGKGRRRGRTASMDEVVPRGNLREMRCSLVSLSL